MSLTAAGMLKTGFKVKGMQPQPSQPFLINHSIGVLARVLKPLAESTLSIAVLRYVILSKSFTHCGCFCRAKSFRASGSCSITLREWFMLHHPERVVHAPSP